MGSLSRGHGQAQLASGAAALVLLHSSSALAVAESMVLGEASLVANCRHGWAFAG